MPIFHIASDAPNQRRPPQNAWSVWWNHVFVMAQLSSHLACALLFGGAICGGLGQRMTRQMNVAVSM